MEEGAAEAEEGCGEPGGRSARAEEEGCARAEAAMLEGHAANRAGELGRACGCFAAAFRLRALPSGGGGAALISLCNMRARQGHHEWCAHALLLLLCSARPLTERERAGVARLLSAPRTELPPVWTAVMLSQLTGSLLRLPSPEALREHEAGEVDALPASPPATAGQPAPHELEALGPPTGAAVRAADVGAADAASVAAAEKETEEREVYGCEASTQPVVICEAETLLKEREANVAAYAVELGVAI